MLQLINSRRHFETALDHLRSKRSRFITCSTPPQTHAQIFPAHHCWHKLQRAPAAGSSSEDKIDHGARPLKIACRPIPPFQHACRSSGLLPLRSHVEKIDEEIIRQCSGPLGENAILFVPEVSIERAQATDQNRHLGSGQRHRLAFPPATQPQILVFLPKIVAEPVGNRSSTANECTSVCSCVASARPGEKGIFTSCPAFFAASSMAASPPRTISQQAIPSSRRSAHC